MPGAAATALLLLGVVRWRTIAAVPLPPAAELLLLLLGW
jgi:hypothetical protein